jgi:hypothetical protein
MLSSRPFRSALSDQQGVALTEFALTLPMFLALIMGGIEVTHLALVNLRLSHVAETAADNASRVRGQMDETDIEEIFAGIQKEGEPINLDAKGRVILSSVEDNKRPGNGRGQKVTWQRCSGQKKTPPKYGTEGKGKDDNSLKDGIGPTGKKVAAQPGTAVMFVEVTYDYTPAIFDKLIKAREIRYETAFNVRERTELGITNVKSKTAKKCT